MTDMKEEDIKQILERYEKHKACCRKYMKHRYHNDEIYRNDIKERAKNYYNTNKESKKQYYEQTKGRTLAFRRWNYAQKVGKVDRYMNKYKEDFDTYIKPSLDVEDNMSEDSIDEIETVESN